MTTAQDITAKAYLAAQDAADAPAHMTIVGAVREGLPIDLVEGVAGELGLALKDLTDAGIVAPRTLSHSRASGRLSAVQSDRIARFFRVFQHAVATFGDSARAWRWMTRPTRVLGGSTPITLFDTDEGTRMVEAVLSRIDHGLAT